MEQTLNKIQTGRRNLSMLYAFTGASWLLFDGALWLIYWQYRGVSLFEVGLLEAVLHIVSVLSDVPAGIFADRFGWRLSLACSSLLGVLYSVMALWAHGFWPAALAFAFRGLQITLTNGSDSSIAYESASWAGMSDRYLAISGRLFAIALVCKAMAEAAGGSLAHWSWQAVYIAYMLANLASFFTVLWIHEPRSKKPHWERRKSAVTITKEAICFAKQSPPFIIWIIFSGTLSGFGATFGFYGQSLLLHAGWTLIGIGILAGLGNGLGALATALAEKLVKRFGTVRTISSAGVFAALGILMFAWLPGLSGSIGYLLDSVADNLACPVIDQELNCMIPSEQRATLLSVNSTAYSIFMIIGFPLFGALAQRVGLVHAACIGSVAGAAAILGVTILWRFGCTAHRKIAGTAVKSLEG